MEHSVQPKEQAQFLANRRKSRIGLLLIISAFVIPAILAKLALDRQWLSTGVTNHGEIPSAEITLTMLGIEENPAPEKWLIVVPLNQCQAQCEKLVEAMSNTRTAIGREMNRVVLFALTAATPLPAKEHWYQQTMPPSYTNHLLEDQIAIVDPLGRVIMLYSLGSTDSVSLGQAIVADMKKLLKYSQIG